MVRRGVVRRESGEPPGVVRKVVRKESGEEVVW